MTVAEREEKQTALRQSVDELSTRLILDSPAAGGFQLFAESLAKIGEDAGLAGYESAAKTAADIAEKLHAAPDDAAAIRALQTGLSQLAIILELEGEMQQEIQEKKTQEEERAAAVVAEAPPVAETTAPAPAANAIAQDPDLLSDFVLEAREHLGAVERNMLLLEQESGNHEAIHAAFRGFHTIKGLAGFLELNDIREVAHEVETLLDMARQGSLAVSPPVVDVILQGADYLRSSVDNVETALRGGSPAALSPTGILIDRVRRLSRGEEAPAPQANPVEAAPTPDTAPAEQTGGVRAQAAGNEAFRVRVDAGKLDSLMDLVGELAIAHSMVKDHPGIASLNDRGLNSSISQVSHIVSELQRTAMTMRLVPVGTLFSRSTRIVRDLSRKAHKKIAMEFAGEETEIDKSISEELADPLMHMVRNSFDHGVETPEERIAAGKNPVAKVRMAACHQGGHIVIEVSDDGRGLNRERILAKARQNGLIDSAANPPDHEVWNLIFEPGFSTAEKVTEVSGRGVGMDVVRRQVQKLRGSIETRSVAGKGTTFLIRLPLTLAIIDGLVIAVGTQRYIVPVFAVREMIQPAVEAVSTVQGRGEMVNVRGRLLPIMRLHRCFGVEAKYAEPHKALLIVAESAGETFCLMVDGMLGKQEVIIKSLGTSVRDIPGIAGGAILGDGRVALILDLPGLRGEAAA